MTAPAAALRSKKRRPSAAPASIDSNESIEANLPTPRGASAAASAHIAIETLREPLRLPQWLRRYGIGDDSAWRCLVDACAPFRAGTRFQALPDVRFAIDGALLRAPGERLPSDDDDDPQAYWRRLRDTNPRADIELRVDEPLILDAPLWLRIRDLLRAALGPRRVPLLPVRTALIARRRARAGEERVPASRDAVLRLLLEGELRWRARDGRWRIARAGDALCLPAGIAFDGRASAETLWFELRIPLSAAGVDAMAEALLLDLLAAGADADAADDERRVPDLAFPAPRDGRRGLPPIAHLRAIARRLAAEDLHIALSQALSATWALRISAHGLEPAPPARPAIRLRRDDRVVLRLGCVVRRRLDARHWLWAVNGHALALIESEALARAWARLCAGAAQRVGDLAGAGDGRGARIDADVVALLQRLYVWHALTRVEAEDAS